MINEVLIAIIPPIIASILTFVLAIQKSRTTHNKNITEMQIAAIEIVQKAEEQMRSDLKNEMDFLKKERQTNIDLLEEKNKTLTNKLFEIQKQKEISETIIDQLKSEISIYKNKLQIFKDLHI